MAQVKRAKETIIMRRFNLLLFTGVIGTAFCASLALALPASRSDSGQPGVNGALSGNWVGNVLPPGISPFEVIRNTVTFRPDGTFLVVTEKPTGSFRGAGTYSVQGYAVSLSFPNTAPAHYRFTRSGDKFHPQLLLLPPDPSETNSGRIMGRIWQERSRYSQIDRPTTQGLSC